MMRLMSLAILGLLVGCADDSCCVPLAYDDSALSEEHRAEFREAQEIWETATGINLFDPAGALVFAVMADIEPAELETNGNLQFSISDETLNMPRTWEPDCTGTGFSTAALHGLGHAIGLPHMGKFGDLMYDRVRLLMCPAPSRLEVITALGIWR